MSINNTMQYKGYYGSVEYSPEDEVLFGKLLGIEHLVSYDGTSITELQNCFKESVDSYLDYCKELGIEPEVPCKEEINIKLDPETQIRASMLAQSENISLDKLIETLLKERLQIA